MAVLIPEIPKDCVNSERQVFERLGRELPDDWIVLHSLGLAGHKKKIWGEADIVVLSTLGIFALEVKGGRVSCDKGIWSYSGDFPTFTKKESPWQQASGAMYTVKAKLEKANGSFKDALFGFGVVMPYTPFDIHGPEILPEVLLDKRHFRAPMGQYISALGRYWSEEYQAKHGKPYRGLRSEEIQAARQILRPDFETALSLGSYLTGTDNRLIYLSNEQIKASRRTASNPRSVVRGPAGTGKSVIAVERACQLSSEGKRVLYLCFNKLLANHIRTSLADEERAENLSVFHVHALYRELIDGAGMNERLAEVDEGDADFFAKLFPELAVDALCEQSAEPWDVLIVDEAQDLLTPEHLDAFDLLVRDGLRRGRWHIFLDPNQNIYSVDIQEDVEARLADGAPAFEDLHENCRNTRQVATEASIVSGIDLAIEGAPNGLSSEVHFYSTDDEALELLEVVLRDLLDRDVRPQDIALLSTRKHDNSLLSGKNSLVGRPFVGPDDEAGIGRGGLLLTTMHAFKGLDRQAIIALDMTEIGQDSWCMLHYAGLSRARGLLHIFAPKAVIKAYENQAKAYGGRIRSRIG